MRTEDIVTSLQPALGAPGQLIAIVVTEHGGLGLAPSSEPTAAVEVLVSQAGEVLDALEAAGSPRFVMWDQRTAAALLVDGHRIARSFDISATHRLVFGSMISDEATVWALLHGLDPTALPEVVGHDLFHQFDATADARSPLTNEGYLHPAWTGNGWQQHPDGATRWAALVWEAARIQLEIVDSMADRDRVRSAIRSESTIEVLCAELSAHGLPIDVGVAKSILAEYLGPEPADEREADAARARRDAVVLATLEDPSLAIGIDLRSPGQVKTLLRRCGIEVADTRSWTLKAIRDRHSVVDALLWWRKAERLETTYGYRWLATNVHNGRLHGAWTGCDGSAGRMTATAGLHSLPAELRDSIRSEPGHVFVRADLGQIEPRVLAAVSGDRTLAAACAQDDLYSPVATALGVDREIAKVAVLGAMYGQTTGRGAEALRRLNTAYPVAMNYLETAASDAASGNDLRTFGGRLIRLSPDDPHSGTPEALRSRAAARGRYGRNAMVQGAAAEFFKIWALLVRAAIDTLDAHIVLCLHDELLIHAPQNCAPQIVEALHHTLDRAGSVWFSGSGVRFVAEVSTVSSWADAKG